MMSRIVTLLLLVSLNAIFADDRRGDVTGAQNDTAKAAAQQAANAAAARGRAAGLEDQAKQQDAICAA